MRWKIATVIVLVAGVLVWFLHGVAAFDTSGTKQTSMRSSAHSSNASASGTKSLDGIAADDAAKSAHVDSKTVRSVAPLMQTLYGSVRAYGVTLASLNRPVDQLTHDELSVRFHLTKRCKFIAAMREGPEGFLAQFERWQQRGQLSRIAAAKLIASACDATPPEMLADDAESKLGTEMLKRGDHPVAQLVALPFSAVLAQDSQPLLKIAKSNDPMAIESAFSMLRPDAKLTRDGQITVEDFRDAWNVAACELVGGCARESWTILDRCLTRNECEAKSPLEGIAMYEPNRLSTLTATYPRLLRAFRSGDWSAFDLSSEKLNVGIVADEPKK
jgi:hypothetical protein